MKKFIGICVAASVCLACANIETASANKNEMDAQVKSMTNCEKINALVQGHSKGFPLLRTQKTHAPRIDIWKARYNLVGDSCQVWGWGAGKFSYMCSVSLPDKETAMEKFAEAKKVAAECLGAEWKLGETARELGEGTKAQFSKAGIETVVGVQAVATSGLFKTEWTAYFFVGSPNDSL